MYELREGVAEIIVQGHHADNAYRLGTLEIWRSKSAEEGISAEIKFGAISDQLPGEFATIQLNTDDLAKLHRNLGQLIEDTAQWPEPTY